MAQSKGGRGAIPVSIEELEEAAEVYNTALDAPTRAVEHRLGLSRRTASRRIQQARELGLITREGGHQ